MQANKTKASASLDREARTSMKGSSQTRTSAWRSRREHGDISISLG